MTTKLNPDIKHTAVYFSSPSVIACVEEDEQAQTHTYHSHPASAAHVRLG